MRIFVIGFGIPAAIVGVVTHRAKRSLLSQKLICVHRRGEPVLMEDFSRVKLIIAERSIYYFSLTPFGSP